MNEYMKGMNELPADEEDPARKWLGVFLGDAGLLKSSYSLDSRLGSDKVSSQMLLRREWLAHPSLPAEGEGEEDGEEGEEFKRKQEGQEER